MWKSLSRIAGLGRGKSNAQATEAATLPEPSPERKAQLSTMAEIAHFGSTAVATLTVTELGQEDGVDILRDLLADISASGATHIVLDIQNVQFMDSACVGCLVEALNSMADKGGRIALANSAQSVQSLFRMTQLDRVFPICADVMAALAAVERETPVVVGRC